MVKKIREGCEPIYLDGNDTGCLLLHGYSSSPYEMSYLADKLHGIGYTISVPLLDGHGTEPEHMIGITWYSWFETVKQALFELRKKCKKIVVIGQSMGGTLALHLAAHYQVEGVAVLAPGLYLKNGFAPLAKIAGPMKNRMYKKSNPDIKENTDTKAYKQMTVQSVAELLALLDHVKNDLPDIYVPALIIHARNDHVIKSKSATDIYELISSKNKRILELQQSYHIITLDVEKEKAFLEIANFISQNI
jgi:carboxylesterase